MTSNTLSDAFQLTRMTIDEHLPAEVEVAGHEKLPEDFDKSRSNVQDLIKIAANSVKELASLASQSQNARMYEALTTAIKTAVDANKTLVELHTAVRETSNIKNNQLPQTNQVQNNLFITTDALQAMIEDARNKKLGQVIDG